MKKIVYIFFLFISFFHFHAISQEVFVTKFDVPFHKLILDSCWDFDDQDKNSISFEYHDDRDIGLDIEVGKVLKDTVSIEKLYKQIKKAKGKISEVPLVVSSFSWLIFLHDLFNLDIQVENYQIISVNGLEGIRAYHKPRFAIEKSKKIDEPDWAIFYVFIVNKRIYVIDFMAPALKFLQMEPFFEATLNKLFMN